MNIMNLKKNSEMTNLAWSKLYDRLNNEGLLYTEDSKGRRGKILHNITLRWALIGMIVVLVSVYLGIDRYNNVGKMLSFSNNDNVTLVKTLEDGSIVFLEKGSEITFPAKFGKVRKIYLKGNAFFEVVRNTKTPFIVDAGMVEIKVLGTSFSVETENHSCPSLSVRSGIVKITLKENGTNQKVVAGETVFVEKNYLRIVPTLDLSKFAVYSERIHFKDEKLSDVVKVVNKMKKSGDLTLILADDARLPGRSLTATFIGKSTESIAQMICFALNLKYEIRGEVIVIYE